jgi:predicted transcriptional regulator
VNKLNVFYDTIAFKNKIQFLEKMLEVYAILNFDNVNSLLPSERKVLLYYVQKGLSQETLTKVCKDVNYNKNYLHTLNKKLRDKGYLIRDPNNNHKFYLNEKLENFRQKFVLDQAKAYIIDGTGKAN